LISGKTVEESVEVGHRLGAICVQQVRHFFRRSRRVSRVRTT
jgi:hypothetical protein